MNYVDNATIASDGSGGCNDLPAAAKRQRRIGIVALARKLMVALWRYLKEDLIPEGAVFA